MSMTDIPDEILEATFRANASAGGVYINLHGVYDLALLKCEFKIVRDPAGKILGKNFINKFRVITSLKHVVSETNRHEGDRTIDEEPHPVGYEPDYVVAYDGEGSQSAEGNAKALILAYWGLEEGRVSKEEFQQRYKDAVSPEQPLRGLVLRATTYPKGVRKSIDPTSKKYTRFIILLSWTCIAAPGQGENSKEKLAERRAEIEKTLAQRDAEEKSPPMGAPPLSAAPGQQAAAPVIPAAADPVLAAGWVLHPANIDLANPWYMKDGVAKQRSQILAEIATTARVDPLAGWVLHPANTDLANPWYMKDGIAKQRSQILAGG